MPQVGVFLQRPSRLLGPQISTPTRPLQSSRGQAARREPGMSSRHLRSQPRGLWAGPCRRLQGGGAVGWRTAPPCGTAPPGCRDTDRGCSGTPSREGPPLPPAPSLVQAVAAPSPTSPVPQFPPPQHSAPQCLASGNRRGMARPGAGAAPPGTPPGAPPACSSGAQPQGQLPVQPLCLRCWGVGSSSRGQNGLGDRNIGVLGRHHLA